MIIDKLIIIDAIAESLNLALAANNKACILAPNPKTAQWLRNQFSQQTILTYPDILGSSARIATVSQSMLLTIITLQEKSPLLLGQAKRYNEIINTFYCDNAKVWPPTPTHTNGYTPHYQQIIEAHIQHMLKLKLVPEAVTQLERIKLLDQSNLEFGTLILVKPQSKSVISEALLDKLKQLATKQESYTSKSRPTNTIPLHITPTTLDEFFCIKKLALQHPNAIIVSNDAKFQQLHQAYYPEIHATLKLLDNICDCITTPNKQQEIFQQHQLDANIVADLENLSSMLQKNKPFTDLIKAHLLLCKKMGGSVDAMLAALESFSFDLSITDYSVAAKALFSLDRNISDRLFSLAEACETPTDVFIIQGMNQKNWPSTDTTIKLLTTLKQRGEVICTRAMMDRNSIYEEANLLANFPLDRIDFTHKSIDHKPCIRPNPTPTLAIRPLAFSVTAIELLIRDPYAYYARYILGLRRKEKERVLAKDFGLIVHEIMAQLQLTSLPNTLTEFKIISSTIYEEIIAKTEFLPEEKTVILRRMDNLVPYIYELLHEWNKDAMRTIVEIDNHKELQLSNGTIVKLKARSDRIDTTQDGGTRIIDYKTGISPSQAEVDKGLYPQLPLEGIINSDNIASLFYIETSGKIDKFTKKQLKYNIETVLSSTVKLLEMFLIDEKIGYFATIHNDIKTLDYQHLSRTEEWKY